MMTRIWADLGVEREFCPPFTPDHKPFIERGFGTVSHDLVELRPNFIGHNVAERRDIEARISFAKRLKMPGEVIAMTGSGADFQTFCDDWCSGASYGRKVHSSLGVAPMTAADNWPLELRRIPDERVLDLLIMEDIGTRIITKNGVSVGDRWFIDEHGLMGAHAKRMVHVLRDTTNPSVLHLYLAEDSGSRRFLCEAREASGLDLAKVAAVQKAVQKKHLKEERERRRERNKEWKDVDVGQMILDVEKAAAAKVISFPRAGVAHTTPALEAFAQAADEIAANKGLTPEQIEAVNQAHPVREETRKELAEIIHLDRKRAERDEWAEKEARFAAWLALREKGQERMTDEERSWFAGYGESVECQSLLDIHEYKLRQKELESGA
jgi:hypothetical protein